MRKLVGVKQIVCGSLVLGGLAVLVIVQTALATPILGVDSTSLAVGTPIRARASSSSRAAAEPLAQEGVAIRSPRCR